MSQTRGRVHSLGLALGLDFRAAATNVRGLREYAADRREFFQQSHLSSHEFVAAADYPCLADRYLPAGSAHGQYFHQDLLVAQMVFRDSPSQHVDVGSRVDGFVAHVASFRDVQVLDVRPLESPAKNISFRQCDITALPDDLKHSTDSLSCLHALEHFGLGRYGDTVDYYGYLKGWEGLKQLLRPGGTLYFSVPIGEPQRVEFNAHRIFSLPYVRDRLIKPDYLVTEFAYVDDLGAMRTGLQVDDPGAETSFGLTHGCAIFRLVKAG